MGIVIIVILDSNNIYVKASFVVALSIREMVNSYIELYMLCRGILSCDTNSMTWLSIIELFNFNTT